MKRSTGWAIAALLALNVLALIGLARAAAEVGKWGLWVVVGIQAAMLLLVVAALVAASGDGGRS